MKEDFSSVGDIDFEDFKDGIDFLGQANVSNTFNVEPSIDLARKNSEPIDLFDEDRSQEIDAMIEQIEKDFNVQDTGYYNLNGEENEVEHDDQISESEDQGRTTDHGINPIVSRDGLLDDELYQPVPVNPGDLELSPENTNAAFLDDVDDDTAEKVKYLQTLLPGLPLTRVEKIVKAFDTTLQYPSMLTLVPILRETMPDYLTAGWLKKVNTENADFVLQTASEGGLVDTALLNTMLQVKANAASLDDAIALYEDEYRKHKLVSAETYYTPTMPSGVLMVSFAPQKPTGYSDRIVLQMLVANKRLTRALAFKQKIEEDGRLLDLASYGTLVEYYARQKQLGSSLLLTKECISVHGVPPSQKYLSDLRILCKQNNLEEDIGLSNLIGEDPIAWLKHGERHLKREMSKKGRDVQLARNRIIA